MYPKSSIAKDLFRGFCLGVANIIPGVSGGTFLLIFGIYQRVFSVLTHINQRSICEMLGLGGKMILSLGGRGSGQRFAEFLKARDFFFLIRLGIGALIAIMALSSLMKYLLLYHFVITYALFFGLILVSLVIPFKLLKKKDLTAILLMAAGMALTMGVSWGVNPYDRVKFKSDRLASVYQDSLAAPLAADAGAGQADAGAYGPVDYFYIAFCGAIAISATVLPGISGALVLILMGAYFDVIAAISDLKNLHLEAVAFLSAFALGIIFGGLMFARLVSFVFSRYYNATMAFLTGLMLGSLYALWPFKQVVIMATQYVKRNGSVAALENVPVYTNINRMPQPDDPLLWAFLAFALGCMVMAGFVRAESKDGSEGDRAKV